MAQPSSNPLQVPYFPQQGDGYCLPACVQMVLAYLGLSVSQDRLDRKLEVRPPLGVPTFNVSRLCLDVLDVTLTTGTLADLQAHVAQGHPPYRVRPGQRTPSLARSCLTTRHRRRGHRRTSRTRSGPGSRRQPDLRPLR